VTAKRPVLCPRCGKPVAQYGGRGPRPTFCGERSCYDRNYDAKRAVATAQAKDETPHLALQGERKRLNREMHKKVAAVVGTEDRPRRRITQPLPRGGALVVLGPRERAELLEQIEELDKAARLAIEVLGQARYAARRGIAKSLDENRRVLALLAEEYFFAVAEPRGPRAK